jgi:hypothetical protein
MSAHFIALILFFIAMERAVHFDDQSRLWAEEIGVVGTDLRLSAEAIAGQLLAAKQRP